MKLEIKPDQRVFFTSDTHYGHSNICSSTTNWNVTDDEGYTRIFKSLDHMNQTIVDNINSVVGENDILIHLGDWSFGGFDNIEEFRNKIVCKNIHLVLGNHDHHIDRNVDGISRLFSSINHYINLDLRVRDGGKNAKVDKYNFILCHFPIASWDGMNRGVMHLHGHTHLPARHRIAAGRAMDVGMDGNGLMPLSLQEVINLLKGRPAKKLALPEDHHEKRI